MSLLLRSSRLAVLALAAATGAHAAEFGDASVRSYSGQPLAADIELTELTTQELADLQVRLARPDVFQGANVKMDPALAGASISIVRRDSRRVLRVTTSAPVRAEVLHLYFQLVSGGRERVRSVSLWLSPNPNPAPAPTAVAAAPAPVAAPAAVPVAAPERAARPASRHATRPGGLVAMASPGKEATPAERELMGAVERALSARGGKVEPREEKPAKPAPGRQDTHKEASKYASTADDFRRGAKPRPAAAEQPKPAVAQQDAAKAEEPENKAPQRSFLPSKAELAEAARATKVGVEGSAAPVAKAAPAAAGQADPAMLNKLAELEGKLKTLQAQLAMTNTAGAARVAVPAMAETAKAAAPAPAPSAAKTPDAAAGAAAHPAPVNSLAQAPDAAGAAMHPAPANSPAQTPDAATMTAAAAVHPAPATAGAAEPAGSQAVPQPEMEEPGTAPAAAEEPKAKPEPKKEAAPPPPEPKKEIKISRPKLLTYLFIGSLVLLGIFGVIVHFIRKAKMKRSPIVRQSWSREEDDVAARVEPVVAAEPESKAA